MVTGWAYGSMGINLSVQQLLVGNSAGHLLELIGSSGMDPRRVTLEITESILIQSIDQAAQVLGKLRQAGIHVALDDFGVGYSRPQLSLQSSGGHSQDRPVPDQADPD